MFWRKDRANSWRNTRRRQDSRLPLAGSPSPDIDDRPLATTGSVEAYLAFVRAEYEAMRATALLDPEQRSIAADLQNLGQRSVTAAAG
jgi:hypothetical protein